VKNILDEVMAIQNNPAMEGPAHEAERAQAIRRIIQRKFDFPHMAQNTLGATYGKLSAGQRQEFADVFSALFQTSYTNMVLRFLKQETVKYGKETVSGGQARVNTTLERTNDAIQVDYLLHQQGGGWLLYDVSVDGVSILEQYRSGFAREIQARSFESLLNKMKTQLKAAP
jgi:phospholipid transport system substrate-binding protein